MGCTWNSGPVHGKLLRPLGQNGTVNEPGRRRMIWRTLRSPESGVRKRKTRSTASHVAITQGLRLEGLLTKPSLSRSTLAPSGSPLSCANISSVAVERGRLRPISTSANFDFGQFRLRPISTTSANFWMLNFWTTKGGAPKGGAALRRGSKGGGPKGEGRPKFRAVLAFPATVFILSPASGPPGLHTTPGASNTTKNQRKDPPREGGKNENWRAREGGPADGLGCGVWGLGFRAQVFGDKNRNRTKRK